MGKDSQIDPKEIRAQKANHQTTIADEEGKNNNRTTKKQSIKRENFNTPH